MCFHGCLAGYLLGVTRSQQVDLYFLNFFNAENDGKRPLDPFQITTPERQRQNADLLQSKASFAVLQRDKTMYKNFGHSSCFLQANQGAQGTKHVSTQLSLVGKKPSFSYLGDFLIACLDVFQQVKEMKWQKCQNTTLLSLVLNYLFILFSTIKITQALHYTKMWRGDLKNHKACMRRPPRYNNIKQQNISTTQQRRIQDALSI